MFDFNKSLTLILMPFVAALTVMLCLWGCIYILERIWLQLLILIAALGMIGGVIALVWFRFRRW